MSSSVHEISCRVCDIISEIVNDGYLPTMEVVLSVLCQRYGVLDFSQLQCGPVSGISPLAMLMEIQNKLQTWIVVQLAVRSIISCIDLDYECFIFLKSFNLHSVRFNETDLSGKSDPCEVDLDVEQQEESLLPTASFEYFGLGPLQRHPLLSCYFDSAVSMQDCIGSERVLQFLLDYLSDQRTQHVGSNSSNRDRDSNFSCEDFIAYMCSELSIANLSEVGVCIRGDLRAERLALQHTLQLRYQLFVQTAKRELAYFNAQMCSIGEGGEGARRKSQGKRKRRKQLGEQEAEGEGKEDGRDEAQGSDCGHLDNDDQIALEGDIPVGVAKSQSDLTGKMDDTLEEAIPEHATNAVVELRRSPHTATAISTGPAAAAVVSAFAFESKMKVYPPDKATAGSSGLDEGDIYTVDNSALQGVLPLVPAPSPPSSCPGSAAAQGGTDTAAVGGMDSREAGRWGEALVYQYLLSRRAAGSCVQWLNQHEESRAAYDFIVSAPPSSSADIVRASQMHHNSTETSVAGGSNNYSSSGSYSSGSSGGYSSAGRVRTEYIEVKTTRFADRNVFELSPFEWQFAAAEPRVPYHVYRVFGAGDSGRVRILVVRDVYNRVLEGRVKLCLAT